MGEFISNLDGNYDYTCCACGTGGTLAGIIKGLNGKARALGFAVLKGGHFLVDEVERLINYNSEIAYSNWKINTDYHFGGYAKIKPELINFVERFERINKIPVEPVYTGKLFYGIYDLIQKGYLISGETILAIHTGALQGLEGMKDRIAKLKKVSINK